MSLTKREIIMKVAAQVNLPQNVTTEVVQATLNCIFDEISQGGHIELRNFGVFEIVTRKSRVGRNPNKPKEEVVIPERKIVKFRAGKELQNAVAKL